MSSFCEKSYLNRIHLTTRPTLDCRGLTEIHKAQHRAIPFENFDVVLGKSIELDHDSLVQN